MMFSLNKISHIQSKQDNSLTASTVWTPGPLVHSDVSEGFFYWHLAVYFIPLLIKSYDGKNVENVLYHLIFFVVVQNRNILVSSL